MARSDCQAACTAAYPAARAGACPSPVPPVSAYAAAAVRAVAVARRSGPCGRTSAGAMQTSQAQAPVAAASARWPGTWSRVCGANREAELTKVRTTLPGGPTRVASHSTFWAAASRAPTVTSTAALSVSEAVTRATASPPSMPSTTHTRTPARAAYGRLWAYRAHRDPAIAYIARSSRPSARSVRVGGVIAATTLSAGLNQMSEGRPTRSTPASGRRGAGGEVQAEGVLLIRTRLTGVLFVKHLPTCRAPPNAPRVPPRARVRAAWPGHRKTDCRAGRCACTDRLRPAGCWWRSAR